MNAPHPSVIFASLALLGAPSAANEIKLSPTDGATDDNFGWTVAIDDQNAVVGALMASAGGAQTGKAYVFDTTSGAERFQLVPTNGQDFDGFGTSVAVDGACILVGSPYADGAGPNHGAAYVYDSSTGQELTQLFAADSAPFDEFGLAVAVDDNLAVIGAPSDDDNGQTSGSAYVFDLNTGTQLAKLVPSDGAPIDFFGGAVAISGQRVLVGSVFDDDSGTQSGSAYVFDATTGAELAKLVPNDGHIQALFGSSVALDGTTALVGARHDNQNGHESGAAYLFNAVSGQQTGKLLSNDGGPLHRFGTAVALASPTAVVGAPNSNTQGSVSGSAYRFDLANGNQQELLLSSDLEAFDLYGSSVALAPGAAGSEAIVIGAIGEDGGSPGAGSAYLFAGAPPVVNYCTAGPSADGCFATLSTTGIASVSAASGFTLRADSVESARSGTFYYGTNGRQAAPWGNGSSFQCVVPPVQRTGLLTGNGTPGLCEGNLAFDLNAFWAAKPSKTPSPGTLVQAQFWYRDPHSTSNQSTSLSDALEFTVCP